MCRKGRLLPLLVALTVSSPRLAHAQACCAGSSAVTPARLALHEDALAGVTLHAGGVLGTYDENGNYTAQPPHTTEVDLEEDFVMAFRLFRRAQVSVLVPTVETYRDYPGESAHGGGVGDINVGARYDFLLAGQSRVVPGIALLAGLTVPSGRPPEDAVEPLATDATGIGAYQANVGLALEQVFRAWLVNVSGILAQRAPRTEQGVNETLGTQFTLLGAVAYAFPNDMSVGLLASYAAEGNAEINGADDPNSHKRVLTLSALASSPISDRYRVQGSVFFTPPVSQVGANQPATAGVTFTIILGIAKPPS